MSPLLLRNWKQCLCNNNSNNVMLRSTIRSNTKNTTRSFSSVLLLNNYGNDKNKIKNRNNSLSSSLFHPKNSIAVRAFTSTSTDDDPLPEREVMSFDVLIVGGGPAGLAAAIRIKQLCQEKNQDLSVCIIDKGRYVL